MEIGWPDVLKKLWGSELRAHVPEFKILSSLWALSPTDEGWRRKAYFSVNQVFPLCISRKENERKVKFRHRKKTWFASAYVKGVMYIVFIYFMIYFVLPCFDKFLSLVVTIQSLFCPLVLTLDLLLQVNFPSKSRHAEILHIFVKTCLINNCHHIIVVVLLQFYLHTWTRTNYKKLFNYYMYFFLPCLVSLELVAEALSLSHYLWEAALWTFDPLSVVVLTSFFYCKL